MAGKQFLKKHENCILSLAMALILAGILAARFDFYYDLNDDVLIKDILVRRIFRYAGRTYHAAVVSAGSIACAVVPGTFDPGIRRVFAFLPVWEYLGGRIQEHRAGGRGAGST